MSTLVGLGLSTARSAVRAGGWAVGQGAGLVRLLAGDEAAPDSGPPGAGEEIDDIVLARRVQADLFRDEDRPRGSVDVTVVDGVVWLRGVAATPELIAALEAEAGAIPGVRGVRGLLRTPTLS